jgi:hypothetical protein
MRITLRRSCAACAKAKHRCDLQTPQCSRCAKRKHSCVYANEPLTSSLDGASSSVGSGSNSSIVDQASDPSTAVILRDGSVVTGFSDVAVIPLGRGPGSFDPFDSYPPTRLPRERVQRLIHHCKCLSIVSRLHEDVANLPSSLQNCIPVLSS